MHPMRNFVKKKVNSTVINQEASAHGELRRLDDNTKSQACTCFGTVVLINITIVRVLKNLWSGAF